LKIVPSDAKRISDHPNKEAVTDQRRNFANAFKWASFTLLLLSGAMAYNGVYLTLDAMAAALAVVFLVIWDRLIRD
jgi:hypothetical protein